jgi:hypothetical protein
VQFLIEFAQEDGEFNRILRSASQYPMVQGVVLDLDRFWLLAWQAQQRLGDAASRLSEFLIDWRFLLGRNPWFSGEEVRWQPQYYPRPVERADIDKWRPPHWDRYLDLLGIKGDGPPLVVKVCLRPRMSADERVPTVEELKDSGGRLRVEVHARSQAQLSSDPRKQYRPIPGGVSIGISAKDYGTLGVILKDANGKHFGLTCSHVVAQNSGVDQPAQVEGAGGSAIGQSVLATTLGTCTSTTPCNPWSGVTANEVDLSLIEIDSAAATSILEILDIGPLSGVVTRSSLSTGQAIEVMGRTTHYSSLQIGGLAVWYRFHRAGQYFCFKNLFEVESPYGSTGAIRAGDSGAPVCTADGSGTGWCGIVVGCDAFKGFAMYSESAQNWLSTNSYTLDVK